MRTHQVLRCLRFACMLSLLPSIVLAQKSPVQVTVSNDDDSVVVLPSEPAAVSPLQLTSPVDYRVVQRATHDQGMVPIAGVVSSDITKEITIQARLIATGQDATRQDATRQDATWQKVDADFTGKKFRANLPGPAGGWYRLEIQALQHEKVIGKASVEHVGIGEVFVVAGQSNSANHGEEKQAPKTNRVVAFDGQQWHVAKDPQPGASGRGGSFIPVLGDALVEQLDVPIGFVACGIGATSVREWLPKGATFPNPPTIERRVEELPSGEWASKGDAFVTFVSRLKSLGLNGFRAVLWHQGESDANQKDPTRTLPGELYRECLETLIRSSRREIGWDAPWFVAQVSYHSLSDTASVDIRAAQASLWQDGIAIQGPDSDALQGRLRQRNGQGVHFSGAGLRAHGTKWAEKIGPWLETFFAVAGQQ